MSRLRLLFFTDNFPPESNAPANRTYEHCVEWVKNGADVTVITCNPNFPKGKLFKGYKNKLFQREEMDGIKVIRVWTFITSNRGTLKRILDYLSFALTSFLASLFVKTDVIIATSPQLFTAVGGCMSAMIKRKPWIMEVRDLWPESIQAVDAINNRLILNSLEGLVKFLYKNADRIVVVTNSFKERISAEGIASDKIFVVKNGVNSSRYYEIPANKDLAHQLNLEDKFVVGYIGTHGMAHNLGFILDCAAQLPDDDIHFLFVGDGAFKSRLKSKCEMLGLANVTMHDAIGRNEVQNFISIIDIALVPLKKSDTFKTVIPSKIFENAAMGKPILLGVEGESREIIQDYNAGVCFDPENHKDFVDKLTFIKQNKEAYHTCVNGALSLARDYNRTKQAERMMDTIKSLVPQPTLPIVEVSGTET